MNCDDTTKLLHAYLDKELDAANILGIEHHLASCGKCRRIVATERELQSSLRSALPYHHAPVGLNDKILAKLNAHHVIDNKIVPQIVKAPIMVGLAVAFSIMLSFSVILYYQRHHDESQLIQDVLEGHLRTVSTDRLTDITTSKASMISTWLKSQIDYAPTIPDLAGEGLELIGAKIEYLQQRKIASIIYKKNGNIVNLFTWPSPDVADAEREVHTKQGYKLIYWCHDYMNYWIVSDMDKILLNRIADYIHDDQTR